MRGDLVNGLFEAVGGVLLWVNAARLYKDKVVKGVWWPAYAFYFGWGLWNLYYYPSLTQWFSFAAGLNVVLANGTWVVLAIYYLSKDRAPLES